MIDPEIVVVQEPDGWHWIWNDAVKEDVWYGPYPTKEECHEAAREACNE